MNIIKSATIGAGIAAAAVALTACGSNGTRPAASHAVTSPRPAASTTDSARVKQVTAAPTPPAPTTPTAEKPSPTTPPLLPLLVVGEYSGMYPTTLVEGQSSEIISVTWQQWGTGEAVGTGQQEVNSCNPDCADGQVTYDPVTIVLSGVENASPTSGGEYTTITETDNVSGQIINGADAAQVSVLLGGAHGGVEGDY